MIKRQQRIEWIAAVAKEYLAAKTAADLLATQLQADPNYGRSHGWEARDGVAFKANLESTYIVRLYAEFEAGLRDYWNNHLNRATHPSMVQLLQSLANQRVSTDRLEDADAVREYRNFPVHDESGEPPPEMRTFTVAEAKLLLFWSSGYGLVALHRLRASVRHTDAFSGVVQRDTTIHQSIAGKFRRHHT